jgi:hypothetical protein
MTARVGQFTRFDGERRAATGPTLGSPPAGWQQRHG